MNIRQKFLVSPIAVILLMMIFGIAAMSGLNTSNNDLDKIYNVHFKEYKNGNKSLMAISQAHAKAFKLITWMPNYDTATINSSKEEISQHIAAARQEISRFQENPDLTEENKNTFQGILESLDKYRKQVANAIDMAEADPNLAMSSMLPAEKTYVAIEGKIAELSAAGEMEIAKQFDAGMQSYRSTLVMLAILFITALALGAFLGRYMSKLIIFPLQKAIQSARDIAQGNLTGRIVANQKDETGDLIRSIAEMQAYLHEMIRTLMQNSSELAELSSTLTSSSELMAAGVEEQSDSASAMSASIEQMAVSIQLVSENSQNANGNVTQSVKLAQQGKEMLDRMAESMNRIFQTESQSSQIISTLGEESQKISAIVNVIKGIADQTNLLALNAAIEAARAGEQGRGFAVVADEVRKLADMTGKATQEIGDMIQGIQKNTEMAISSMKQGVEIVSEGVSLSMEARKIINSVEEKTGQIAVMVNEITLAISEQALASKSITQNVENISRRAEQNSASTRETASSAQRLSDLAGSINQLISRFHT